MCGQGISTVAVGKTGGSGWSLLYSPVTAPIDQGAEVRAAFMSIEKGFATYSEGMTLASQNAGLGDLGASRRR
jgi:hypothetical protein